MAQGRSWDSDQVQSVFWRRRATVLLRFTPEFIGQMAFASHVTVGQLRKRIGILASASGATRCMLLPLSGRSGPLTSVLFHLSSQPETFAPYATYTLFSPSALGT